MTDHATATVAEHLNARLDRAPLGRNEGDFSWFARHDTYDAIVR